MNKEEQLCKLLSGINFAIKHGKYGNIDITFDEDSIVVENITRQLRDIIDSDKMISMSSRGKVISMTHMADGYIWIGSALEKCI